MSTLHKCCTRVFSGGLYTGILCGRNAKFERDGKHFCGTHDPVARAAKDEARINFWRDQFLTKRAAADAQLIAAAPDMLEALQAIAKNDPHRLMTSGDIAREAIAKATGEAV